jgi:hypothetical protein
MKLIWKNDEILFYFLQKLYKHNVNFETNLTDDLNIVFDDSEDVIVEINEKQMKKVTNVVFNEDHVDIFTNGLNEMLGSFNYNQIDRFILKTDEFKEIIWEE